jgi:DNA-binding HxlR family transcriptional regulator
MAILGEPWTALILRDLVLTARLSRLADDEIVVKRAYLQRPERFDYVLTGKGWQLLHAADTEVTPLR